MWVGDRKAAFSVTCQIGLAQQRPKSCLQEMPVVGQRRCDLFVPHNEEAGAVRKTPTLVGHVPISLERFFEKLAGLGNDDNFGRVSKRDDSTCRCLPQMSPVLTETVQKLHENHFAGYDLLGGMVARNCRGC